MGACKCNMLISAHQHAYVLAPACVYGYMHVIVCGVCVGAYADNNECVYVDLQLLVCSQYRANEYYTHIAVE